MYTNLTSVCLQTLSTDQAISVGLLDINSSHGVFVYLAHSLKYESSAKICYSWLM